MEYTIQSLGSLDDHLLEHVALLHRSVMHLLLDDLGFPMILRYYQVARNDPSVVGFCAISCSQEILGWVVGSPDPHALSSGLQRPRFWFLKQMLRLAIMRPLVFLQVLMSVFFSPEQKLPPYTVELTYIGVAPEVQGSGIGRALLKAFTEASLSAGYDFIELTTETENLHALALYEKSGFVVKRTFREGRFERYRMERKLLSS